MSKATPMKPVARAVNYMNQNGGANSMGLVPATEPRRLTGPQKRRIKHKNNRMLGAERNATPKQVKNRQTRPAPVPGGLRMLLSPSQVRKRVAARSARTGIKFNVKGDRRPDVMIIDDPIRMGNGDR